LVTLEDAAAPHFILQRLNTRVFRRPDLVMANLLTVTSHMHRRLETHPLSPPRRWEVPRVLLTRDHQDHFIDTHGSFWRALSFIDNVQTFDLIHNLDHAWEVGFALGLCHNLLSDLPAAQLADTLPGFHITPHYLKQYDEILAQASACSSPEIRYASHWVEARRSLVPVLERAKAQGKLTVRPTHGDPKVNNVLLDAITGQAVSLIDLDTVKPGLVHYDIGDCLRSGCNLLGEETDRWETVRFDLGVAHAILQGYLSQAREFLSSTDWDYLFDAIRLIAFELGLRFFTDYLAGNVYFKVNHSEHNLVRALVQFKLTESIESQEAALRTIIRELR
jgi:Ser/Thr protein kinase RdoA (MazF antagonist)